MDKSKEKAVAALLDAAVAGKKGKASMPPPDPEVDPERDPDGDGDNDADEDEDYDQDYEGDGEEEDDEDKDEGDDEEEMPAARDPRGKETMKKATDGTTEEANEPVEIQFSDVVAAINEAVADALSPIVKSIGELRQQTIDLTKAVNGGSEIIEDLGEKYEVLRKSLDAFDENATLIKGIADRLDETAKTTPATGSTTAGETTGTEVLVKAGITAPGADQDEKPTISSEDQFLILKALDVVESGVALKSWEQIEGERMRGAVKPETIVALRKEMTDRGYLKA